MTVLLLIGSAVALSVSIRMILWGEGYYSVDNYPLRIMRAAIGARIKKRHARAATIRPSLA
jgi:hypothetical protein